ncbi:hypothetical protein T10_12148 [Trichinella papuae]|uniref:Uncharacterized protein n=1 Tax=Trichinella papuae TaxID=268474 RepID=A0A0V1LXF8_9BILA|nr:hypothetical protein T10_12148 [Trichinella papuae]
MYKMLFRLSDDFVLMTSKYFSDFALKFSENFSGLQTKF